MQLIKIMKLSVFTKKQQKLIVINRILNEKFKNSLPYQLQNIILQNNRLNLKNFYIKYENTFNNFIYKITEYNNTSILIFNEYYFMIYDFNLQKIKNIENSSPILKDILTKKYLIRNVIIYDKFLVLLIYGAYDNYLLYLDKDFNVIHKIIIKINDRATSIIKYKNLLFVIAKNIKKYNEFGELVGKINVNLNLNDIMNFTHDVKIIIWNDIIVVSYFRLKKIDFLDENGNILNIINSYIINIADVFIYNDNLYGIDYDTLYIYDKSKSLFSAIRSFKKPIFLGIYNGYLVLYDINIYAFDIPTFYFYKDGKFVSKDVEFYVGNVDDAIIVNDKMILTTIKTFQHKTNPFKQTTYLFTQIWDDS